MYNILVCEVMTDRPVKICQSYIKHLAPTHVPNAF
nr:MAG TPA: hypothetical protein [Caudoviricetes sp.]